jgi:biotin-dependent carboxylase-like uncharacterized protein
MPTVYDGLDLEEVAHECRLTTDDVVTLHSSREYRVLMLGFSPGFAYMGFVDPRLHRPRRTTPRTRVPQGAVAIAGAQTGVYPRSLPGGWNLLGRTSLGLFDTSRESPSLLMPGDRVRFVPTRTLTITEAVPKTRYVGDALEIVEPGFLTTIQDGGRKGKRRVAVPWAGYADRDAAVRTNRCVGNAPDAPVIEICGPGLRIAFEQAAFVAVSGAHITASIERADFGNVSMTVSPDVGVRVRPGNTLVVTDFRGGRRGYVAVAGLEAPSILGSAAADPGSDFLRTLEAGDRFSIGSFDADRVLREKVPVHPRTGSVRVVLGPQADHFSGETIAAFLNATWRVGLASDRVGARLDGERLTHAGPKEIVSDGMVPGCIQVPPDGRPIVMLGDCPTSGGYPKIGCVVSDDIGVIAQAVPGETAIRFEAVRVEDL